MYCLKCGCDVKLPNVFCDPCLENMASCPVRSDAVINIPEHPLPVTEKKSRKKKRTDTDRLRRLRRWTLCLYMAIVVLTTLVCLMGYQLARLNGIKLPTVQPPKGQNYSTQQTTTPPATQASTPAA